MKRTKIIATIGPSSIGRRSMRKMIIEGVDVFRLNMSHFNDTESVKESVDLIREVSNKLNKHIGILMDIAGPKIRVAKDSKDLHVKKGDLFTIGTKSSDIKINIDLNFQSVEESSSIKIDDGKLAFKVCEKISSSQLRIKSLSNGIVTKGKGVNFPNIHLKLPVLTNKDKKDVLLGLELNIDWFALSFVRSSQDIQAISKILKSNKVDKPIIAKIEKPEAVNELDAIINSFDGVLVARGDLGVEVGYEKVPIIQNRIIRLSHKRGKPVILATQMLDSMIHSNIPTRAEVNDVAVSVQQSCDAVMLTAETSIGRFPIEAIKMMKSIIQKMEEEIKQYPDYKGLNPLMNKMTVQSSISHSACSISKELNIDLIVAMTESGSSAISISSFRPKTHIIAMSPSKDVCKKLSMIWGLEAIYTSEFKNSDQMIKSVEKYLVQNKILKKGESYIIIAGVPVGISGTTNLIRVEKVN